MAGFNFALYFWCVLGIVVSVLLPVLWKVVRERWPATNAGPQAKAMAVPFWDTAKPYLALGVASALTALVLIALTGDQIADFKAALLAGYAWDSTLQKLR